MLFFSFLVTSAFALGPLSPSDEDAIERTLAREVTLGVKSGHETVVHVQRDAGGARLRTARSVLIISGLFNSPAYTRAIETHYVNFGLNVINLRLAGHFEADRWALLGKVRWQEWEKQAEDAIAIARRLGDETLLIGHSTGALLLTWLAARDPSGVAGLCLFAPAFGVHGATTFVSRVSKGAGIPWVTPRGRVIAGHAGLEVERMTHAFRDEFTFEALAKRLRDIPIWMGLTEIDVVIDEVVAYEAFAALVRAGGAARTLDLRPSCERILHDALSSSRNPHLPDNLATFDRMSGTKGLNAP